LIFLLCCDQDAATDIRLQFDQAFANVLWHDSGQNLTKNNFKMQEVKHKSVGAIIRSGDGKYFLIERNTQPFGFAGIAGHIDPGEIPEQALKREIKEESGFNLLEYKLVVQKFIAWNWCNKGVTGHDWYLFECRISGKITPAPREVKSSGWYSLAEIQNLRLEPVWEYWFKELGIL